MKTLVIIPSRLSATRLPGKPLFKVNGLSIISHVFKKAEEAKKRMNESDNEELRVRLHAATELNDIAAADLEKLRQENAELLTEAEVARIQTEANNEMMNEKIAEALREAEEWKNKRSGI